MAELLGRQDGYSRGLGGSMHVVIPKLGLLGTNGIVGAGLPIATGAAYAAQVQGRDDVSVSFFGEGATSTGAFGEAINIAALWGLPLVFVCENNQWVELMSQEMHVPGEIWRRGESMGIPGVRVDGNDVDAVAAAMTDAVDRARRGEGPTLIEAVTFRWFGHFAGDRATYRDEAEVDAGRADDPVARGRGALNDADAEAIDAEVEQLVVAALAFALASPPADETTLLLEHTATA
jgi:TPP-dependent pyruvate/acetoin dehydrogenase alpha subunit